MTDESTFDYEHYNMIKEFVASTLKGRPWCYEGSMVDWAISKLQLVSYCIQVEDYEGAKATSDAIREFLNQWLDEPIPETAIFKLPKYEQKEVHGIICLVNPDDPSGMDSDGAITF